MMKKGSSPATAPVLTTQSDMNTTPEPSGGIIYEAPPPPPAPARFVPIAAGAGDAPALPMLGTNTTPLIGYSRVLLAALPEFEEAEVESETLEASPSDSELFDVTTLTPLFGVLHVPSSDRRQVNHDNKDHFLPPKKAKSCDKLINEATKA
jgi:hypothetical protein